MLNVDSNNMYTTASRYYTHIYTVNHTKIQGLRFFFCFFFGGGGVAGFILASIFLLHLIGDWPAIKCTNITQVKILCKPYTIYDILI